MEIHTVDGGAKVELTIKDMREAGLSFESFRRGDEATERFLSSLFMVLRSEGALPAESLRLDVEVSETAEGMELRVRAGERRSGARVIYFNDPGEYEEALSRMKRLCEETELWKHAGRYALIGSSECSPGSAEERLRAAVIREHGELLAGDL